MKTYKIPQNIILHFRGEKSKIYSALEVITSSTTLSVKDLINEGQKILLCSFSHKNLNTQLDLTDVSPYAILQFDDEGKFNGYGLSLGSSSGSFGLIIQARHVLILPFDQSFPLGDLEGLDLEQIRKS